MSDYPSGPIASPGQALAIARVIWGALAVGSVVAAVVLYSVSSVPPSTQPIPRWVSVWLPAGLMLVAPFVGHVIRQQAFKAGWSGQAVTPEAYVKGTIGFLAPLEAVVVLTGVMMLVAGHRPGHLIVIGIGVAFMLFNFPTGSSMRPQPADDRIGNFDG